MTVKELEDKRKGLQSQLIQAANNVKAAEAGFNEIRGAIMALDALKAELQAKEPAKKSAKKGKK